MSLPKISETELGQYGVTLLPNVPPITATALKEKFEEKSDRLIAPKYNELTEILMSANAAGELGAKLEGNNTTIQGAIDTLKTSSDADHETLNSKMTTSVYDANGDGKVNSADTADTLTGLTASVAELNYTDGVTSNIQDQLDSKVDTTDIPTNLSDLASDSNHRTVTDAEKAAWNNKSTVSVSQLVSSGTKVATVTVDGNETDIYSVGGGASSWNDISGKPFNTVDITGALKITNSALGVDVPTSLADLSDDSTHRLVTDSEKQTWNNKSDFSGSYTDLTNKPTIPDELADLASDSTHRTVTDAEKTAWNSKQSDAYKTVKVGSIEIDASGSDILELAAGANVTITPDPVTKKVTINSTGGGGGTSTGDMLKEIYDTDNDGIVDSAETIVGLTASVAELNYVDGVTSNIQTQINAKANSANLATVATSGSYNDLSNKPTIPSAQVNSNWNATSGVAQILNKPTLATVATSGSYNDLSNKPTIPTITDTYSGTSSNGMSGKAVKSAIDALDGTLSGSPGAGKTLTAFSQSDGKVSATFGNISITKSQVSDFPTIPTVNNGTFNVQQNGTTKGSSTANQSGTTTANIVTDEWKAATATVSNGSFSFSGLDDTQGWGFKPFVQITGSSTNKNPSAQISSISGAGTASMSLTYTTDADNGATVKLRIIK